MEWIGRNILDLLGLEDSRIQACTKHNRSGIIFRGRPAYRGGQGWYDWALFQWQSPNENERDMFVPGHIITFLELRQDQLDKLEISEYVIGHQPGVYALIESLEEELTDPTEHHRVVTIAGKSITAGQRKQRCNQRLDMRRSNILLVTAECIYEPISAIPNFGGERGEYIFIRSPETWGDCFTDYIGGN